MEKIRVLSKPGAETNSDLIIAVGGGITFDNVKEVVEAGENLVTAVSSVFGAEDISTRGKEFLASI